MTILGGIRDAPCIGNVCPVHVVAVFVQTSVGGPVWALTWLHTCRQYTNDVYSGSHPRHITQNGSYRQFLRLRLNCFFDYDFNRHADNMAQHYLKRGYPQDLIKQSRDKAFAVLHHDLVHKSVKKTASESPTPLVTTYNKTNPDLMGLIHKYWPILQSTTRGATLFKNLSVRAYRRSENLRDILGPF